MKNYVKAGFETLPNRDSIVILGAGGSLTSNIDRIREYIAEHHSTVIGCNYNYPIKTDYTFFIGRAIYKEQYKSITSKKVIVTGLVYGKRKSRIEKDIKRKYYVVYGTKKVREGDVDYRYQKSPIRLKKGNFCHWLTNCGFTALVTSVFFRPSNILVAGMDGPNEENLMTHFNELDGRAFKGDQADKVIPKRTFLQGPIMSFLTKHGVEVRSFPNDAMWGIDKEAAKVVEI